MKNLVLQSTRDNVFAVANVAHSVFLYWVMRMQPLLAYWLHSEVDEGAQEKRSLLSAHTYTPLQISTPSMRLQRRTRKARLDRGSCPTMRPVKGSPEDTSRPVNFAKRGNVSVFL